MSNSTGQKFKVGDRVRHETLGDGLITQDGGVGDYKVEFDQNGVLWIGQRALTNLTVSELEHPSRAMIAAMAMQGLIQGITWMDANDIICTRPQDVAEIATVYADALIAELQKPKP